MKPLKRPTKKANCKNKERLEAVCSVIRKNLHLEHLERNYQVSDEYNATASAYIFNQGWRLHITLYKDFWDDTFEMQLRYLIHEHIHVALHALHQAQDNIMENWVSPHQKSQVDEINKLGGEIAVDHLTEVFYRLLEQDLIDL